MNLERIGVMHFSISGVGEEFTALPNALLSFHKRSEFWGGFKGSAGENVDSKQGLLWKARADFFKGANGSYISHQLSREMLPLWVLWNLSQITLLGSVDENPNSWASRADDQLGWCNVSPTRPVLLFHGVSLWAFVHFANRKKITKTRPLAGFFILRL